MNRFSTHLRTLRPLSVFAVLLGACVGLLGGAALAKNVTCSHVNTLCQGTNSYDAITGWENQNYILAKGGRDDVWGYGGFDEIFGEGDADNLNGGAGNDRIYGTYGNDSYWVTGGNEGLFGTGGADAIFGGVGQDFLEGGAGGDEMQGNDHSDVFFAEDAQQDYVNGNGATPGVEQPCYVDGYDVFSNCTPH